ncbi:hypothetical protein [Amycolatopsis sp. NPDC059021]|uniref:hypothetical protein n=1 Tax=Amycolatopsis sp. NPDC059021 TaxID=3346704 RepID=UPI00366C941C
MSNRLPDLISPPRKTVLAQRAWVYLGLVTVTLLNVISYANVERDAHRKAWGDAVNYFRMSEQTGAPVDNPFALRMLSPWLVHRAHLLTGFSLDTLWLGLTIAATLAAVIVFFEFLWRHLNLRLFTAALVAAALACTFWYAPYAFSNPYLVDPLNNLLYVCAIWAAFRRRLVLFTVFVIVGSLNKETTLLLAPLYPLLVWTQERTLRHRGVLGGIAALVVSGAAYFGYRLWAQHLIGGDYGFGTGQANASLLDNIRFALSANKGTDQLELFTTFHFLWLIFAYGLYRLYRAHGLRSELLVASLWLFACCVAGRLVATDTARVIVMMAPLVLAVTAVVLDRQRGEHRRAWVGLLLFLYVALSLRWIPAPASLVLDVAGAAGFVVLATFPVRSRSVIPTFGRPASDDQPASEDESAA